MGRKLVFILIWHLFAISIAIASNFNNFRVPIYFNWKSGIAYDSNYLKLSTSEINELHLYPAYLGDSETRHSLIAKNSLTIQYKPFVWEKHQTKIKFKLSTNNYFASKEKSYSLFGMYLAQHIGKYEWLRFGISYMPKYYLRGYRDRDDIVLNENTNNILVGCEFSQESITLSYSKKLNGIKKSWMEGEINYKTQYYNPAFTEFDLEILSYGLSIYLHMLTNYSISTKMLVSRADNASHQIGIDRSYNQQSYSVSMSKSRIDLTWIQKLGVSYIFVNRSYNSNEIADPLHNGRFHDESKIAIWISAPLNDVLHYKLYGSCRDRITKADNPWVEELKDFSKYELLFQLSYYFTSDILY
tara:strand:- start:1026 stop:2096 length:1071 start_codon:yes stop_codon:yes gene_type:complete